MVNSSFLYREKKILGILALFLFFALWSCDKKQSIENKNDGKKSEIPLFEKKEENIASKSILDQKIQEFNSLLQAPYRIVFYYNFLDTPHNQSLDHKLECHLNDFLGKEKKFFSIAFFSEKQGTEAILYSKNLQEDLGQAFWEKARDYEIALCSSISMSDKKIQMRSLHFNTARISPVISLDFSSSQEAIRLLCENFFSLLGLEGYILDTQGKKVTIAFRNFLENKNIQEGSHFWVFNQNRLWADSLVRLEKIVEGSVLIGYGEFLGSRLPQSGLKVKQIYFPGGSQRFQLVNLKGESQSGFSIFAHYEGYSNRLENYLCTTDSTGEFILSDSKKKPVYLLIAKNIEGVYFDFVKKIVVLQPGDSLEKIQVQDWQPLKENAQKILSEETKTEKNESLRILVNVRLEQVKEYIAAKELDKALLALKLARQHCEEMQGEGKIALKKILEDVEKIYEDALFKTKVKEDYISACKLIEEGDECIIKLDYEKAQSNLNQAEKVWPKNFYEIEYKELQEKKRRMEILKTESSLPIGKARAYIVKNLFSVKPEELNSTILKITQEHIKILFEKGEMDKNTRYNDYELWLKLRIFLNELSQKSAHIAQKYLGSYQKASTEKDKTMFYEKHKEAYDASQTIDLWLQNFKK